MMPTGRLAHHRQFYVIFNHLCFFRVSCEFFIQWHIVSSKKERDILCVMMMKWIDPSIEINWEHFVLNQYNDWYCSKVLLIMIELRFVHVSLNIFCVPCIQNASIFFVVISIRVVNFWYSIINNRIWWSMDRARKMNKKHINDWTQKIWIKNRYQDILLLFMIGAAIDVLFWFLFCIFRRFFRMGTFTHYMWDIGRWTVITCVSCKLTAKYNARRHKTTNTMLYSVRTRIVFNSDR